jgi:hypothetical protein
VRVFDGGPLGGVEGFDGFEGFDVVPPVLLGGVLDGGVDGAW